VSTQLIEAGVDIDFPCVYRQMAGLDSILQAAGTLQQGRKIKQGYDTCVQDKGEKRLRICLSDKTGYRECS
jgi:CRISPR/Cas system-associated endonuclease/helicase Cas3